MAMKSGPAFASQTCISKSDNLRTQNHLPMTHGQLARQIAKAAAGTAVAGIVLCLLYLAWTLANHLL